MVVAGSMRRAEVSVWLHPVAKMLAPLRATRPGGLDARQFGALATSFSLSSHPGEREAVCRRP
jgi:hypothetical protein